MPPSAKAASIRTASEAADYLEGLINLERRPDFPYHRVDLEPIRELVRRLGQPQRGLSVIHVAGSKGKGSTALFAEALLLGAGRRVGTFTSPHLERWTERFRIDGREVEGAKLAAAVDRMRPHVDALRAGDPAHSPSFFDATTAAALLLFRGAGVDCAVLEVGLGGRLDSTNVVEPAVACVTSIELEHTDTLGTTLAEIAREKAGILKPGVPAVLGELPRPAREVVVARATELGAPLAVLGRDFRVETLAEGREGLQLRMIDGPVDVEVRIPVLGAHQAANAALALACVRRAGGVADAALPEAVAKGLAGAQLPGRIELLGRDPTILVDAAHTAASARALARALSRLPRRRTRLVLSVSSGKDTASILRALLPEASEVTVTRADPTRSLAAGDVAAAVRAAAPDLPLEIVPDAEFAVRAAREGLGAEDLICVTGSVYLAGIARRLLRARRRRATGPGSESSEWTPLAEP
jgi:dihydrofolate synthase/folylpolyglutamate synthase